MPFSVVAEFILKSLAEIVIYVIGYFTGRVVVPILTAGVYRVERISFKNYHDEVRYGVRQQSKQARVISAEAGIAIGFVCWVLVIMLAVYLGKIFDV